MLAFTIAALGFTVPALGTTEDNGWVYVPSRENENGSGATLRIHSEGPVESMTPTRDTALISYMEGHVLGKHPRLSISANDTNRVLLAFDFVELRGEGRIEKAELELDVHIAERPPAAALALGVHAVSSEWSEGTTNWIGQPDFEKEPSATAELAIQKGAVRLDVTELVREWAKGARANEGILLKATPRSAATTGGRTPTRSATHGLVPDLTLPFEQVEVEPLPWPHQAPGLGRRELRELRDQVWVINDFPLYQSNVEGTNRYFHGGLDIVLPNGTTIYAIQSGWVKAVVGSTVVVAGASDGRPAYGWSYSHVGDFRVEVGDEVARGDPLGVVEFRGLEHLHLSKVFSEGEHWADWKYICPPYDHFEYTDEDPPVLSSTFHFFENDGPEENDAAPFPVNDEGRAEVSGAVDIVVGMRDAGRFARAKDEGRFGDRLGVARIEYRIRGRGVDEHRDSFDFRKIRFRKGYYDKAYATALTRVVFKHWSRFEEKRPHGSRTLSYYVITNSPTEAWVRELTPGLRTYAWDTRARRDGKPAYPDGEYEITVTAYDFRGNAAKATSKVLVRNED